MRVNFKVLECDSCDNFDSYILSEKLSGKEMNRVGLENIYLQVIMEVYIYRIYGSYFDSCSGLEKLFNLLEISKGAAGYIFNIYYNGICISNLEKFKERILIELY